MSLDHVNEPVFTNVRTYANTNACIVATNENFCAGDMVSGARTL